jgi:hypothetical protein
MSVRSDLRPIQYMPAFAGHASFGRHAKALVPTNATRG